MDHCEFHTQFDEMCESCRIARQRTRREEESDDSLVSDVLTTMAVEQVAESIMDSPAQEASVPAADGFSSDANDGEFGGAGAGGNY